ncbi:hypothetical protein [Streptomyces iconiensis]|uniref:Uncharacterized protein n=1 Tax=Streptomyces iconiensis TaxID=1384038 RepID=A0ABT7AAR4_9ACTN|nr:hypothetical protein [Streptomyces iconiensis]MDJ1137906.1 hypothetical protein [Streptomyces iconiensis]
MTPADEIRTAAEKLRTLAAAASTNSDGTPTARWNTEPVQSARDDDSRRFLYGDYLTRDDGRRISWPLLLRGGRLHQPSYMHSQHAEYAAAMGPAVGAALAAWLESWTGLDVREDAAMAEDLRHALTVARAINQQDPT